MAAYVTAAELRAIVPNMFRDAALADSGGGDTADPGLLDAILESACEEVDALIEARVKLPIARPGNKLRVAARYIALQLLFIRRGLELPKDAFEVVSFWRRWLQKAGEGELRLDAPAEATNLGGPPHSGAITSRPAITGSSGLIGAIAVIVGLSVGSARAQIQPRTWAFELPKDEAFQAADYMAWAQGESVALTYAGAPAESRNVRWQIVEGTNLWLDAEAARSARAWTWNLVPTQSAIPAGRYDGRIMVYSEAGDFIRLAAQQSIIVHASPRARDLALATPLRDIEHRVADWMAAWEEHISGWEHGAARVLNAVEADADAVVAAISAAADTLLAAATNLQVTSIGGPLMADFFSVVQQLGVGNFTQGWGRMAVGGPEVHGSVVARPVKLGLRETFRLAFTNVRSSVPDQEPEIIPIQNLDIGAYSANPYDIIGTTTGLHWSAGVEAGSVGIVDVVMNTWTSRETRIFPGYGATTGIYEFLSFTPGSLRGAVNADMTNRLATGEITPFLSVSWPELQRNPDAWIGDMDITCVSPYNSTGKWTFAGTVVTPQHFVFASHWPTTTKTSSKLDGQVMYWLDKTNGVHARTCTMARVVSGDLSVGRLDSPLPPSITPAKIISTNDWAKFRGVACIHPPKLQGGPDDMIAVHFRPFQLRAVRLPFDQAPYTNLTWSAMRDPNIRYSDLHSGENFVAGDSGSPILISLAGETVIAMTLSVAGGGGPNIATLAEQIESTMATLGPSDYLTLTRINLAGWPAYQ